MNPDNRKLLQLATNYFMEYAPKVEPDILPAETTNRLNEKYINLLTDLPHKTLDPSDREQKARVLVYRWLEETCAASYLIVTIFFSPAQRAASLSIFFR